MLFWNTLYITDLEVALILNMSFLNIQFQVQNSVINNWLSRLYGISLFLHLKFNSAATYHKDEQETILNKLQVLVNNERLGLLDEI